MERISVEEQFDIVALQNRLRANRCAGVNAHCIMWQIKYNIQVTSRHTLLDVKEA